MGGSDRIGTYEPVWPISHPATPAGDYSIFDFLTPQYFGFLTPTIVTENLGEATIPSMPRQRGRDEQDEFSVTPPSQLGTLL